MPFLADGAAQAQYYHEAFAQSAASQSRSQSTLNETALNDTLFLSHLTSAAASSDNPESVRTMLEVMWRFLRKVVVRSIENMHAEAAITANNKSRWQTLLGLSSSSSIRSDDSSIAHLLSEEDVVIDVEDMMKFQELMSSVPPHAQRALKQSVELLERHGFSASRMMADITSDVNSMIQQKLTLLDVSRGGGNTNRQTLQALGLSCATGLFVSLLNSSGMNGAASSGAGYM